MKNGNMKNVLILVGIFIFVLGVSCLINNNSNMLENFDENEDKNIDENEEFVENMKHDNHSKHNEDDEHNKEDRKENLETFEGMTGAPTDNVQPGCLPKDQLRPQELLPQDNAANQWSQVNPQGAGSLMDKNLLQAGHHVGINTVGQTLRNANLQLRSDPPNPQVQVSPWIQSTINPDTNRKPFEIGGCA
jgi:hypothetical protein